MTRTLRRTLRRALPVVLAAAAAPAQPASTAPTPMAEHTVTVDGRARRYLVQVPGRVTSRAPAVLVFHGFGGSAEQIAREHGFRELAEREGFLAVFPDGVDRRWRDGYAVAERGDVDDYAYVRALLADLARRYPVDARRVYAAGHSNGAFFTQALACRLPGTFAAIGPVAGQLSTALGGVCRDAAPVSAVQVHGTADGLVPFEGGRLRAGVELLSAESSAALRAERAGCAATPTETRLPDRDPSDGTTARRLAWTGCADGRGVELWVVEGGSHRWPGSSGFRPRRRLARTGTPSREIDATRIIWEFFAAHPGR